MTQSLVHLESSMKIALAALSDVAALQEKVERWNLTQEGIGTKFLPKGNFKSLRHAINLKDLIRVIFDL